jgi:hypothetical protein
MCQCSLSNAVKHMAFITLTCLLPLYPALPHSVPFWIAEACGAIMMVPFCVAMWWQQDREDRDIRTMHLAPAAALPTGSMASDKSDSIPDTTIAIDCIDSFTPQTNVPSVDVYVVTYSESVAVVQPTVVAALNMYWPGVLNVHVCDDGRRTEMKAMVVEVDAALR